MVGSIEDQAGSRLGGRAHALLAPTAQREFRLLFAAQLISGLGDWAGRLALAALVFDRSSSTTWTAAVTVVALLPWLGFGQLLSSFADRMGRVTVMVVSDLIRAALFTLMLFELPLWALLALAFLAGLCVPPFVSARAAAMVDVVQPELYGKALALSQIGAQAELLIGYALGGVLLAALGPSLALGANAVTFLVSAMLLARLSTSAAATRHLTAKVGFAGVAAGSRVWWSEPWCRRALMLFAGTAMFVAVPEALIVPLADALDVQTALVGVLAASVPIGTIVAAAALPDLSDHTVRLRSAAWIAVIAGALGAGFFVIAHEAGGGSQLAGAAALVATGVVAVVGVPTNQVVGERLPKQGRASAMAVAGGVAYGTQVAAVAAAGVFAAFTDPVVTSAVAMLAAVVVGITALRPIRADVGERRADPSGSPVTGT